MTNYKASKPDYDLSFSATQLTGLDLIANVTYTSVSPLVMF